MDKYTATEMAYKHGYEKGYEAAKAEEKHGHWIVHSTRGRYATHWVECSECLTCGSPGWKRCPVCEAVMDAPNITEETNDALKKMGTAVHGGKNER